MEKEFNAKEVIEFIINWVQDYMNQFGPSKKIVIGMSGGKDSTISAALLAKAIGSERIIGVGLPQGNQGLNDADKICEHLGIEFKVVPIGDICSTITRVFLEVIGESAVNKDAVLNLPARVRMISLYYLSPIYNALVVNNCNYSEDYVGYATKFGDGAGDFSILSGLTVSEILEIGDTLGLPKEWVHKTPDDGLPGSHPDEEKFGFTYKILDQYIYGMIDIEYKDKIEKMHKANLHKLLPMPFPKIPWISRKYGTDFVELKKTEKYEVWWNDPNSDYPRLIKMPGVFKSISDALDYCNTIRLDDTYTLCNLIKSYPSLLTNYIRKV